MIETRCPRPTPCSHDRLSVSLYTIWLDNPPAEVDALRAVLSPDEKARADRLRFPQDRLRWVRARAALRGVLGRHLDCPPERVEFAYGAHGKPRLAAARDHARLRFNLSHSGGVALLAVTGGMDVGVDVELIRTDFDTQALALAVFASDERDCLRSASPEARLALFFMFWTAKEAVVKALGAGLSCSTTGFSVAALTQEARATAEGLTVCQIAMPGGYAAALAAPGQNPYICHQNWHG